MPKRTYFDDRRRHHWSAVMVLAIVCSLTVSVVTRYSTAWNASSSTVKTVQTHSNEEPKRQRLAKDAADWIAPAIYFAGLRPPIFCPRISAARPSIAKFLLDDGLYNRPPPFPELLS
jgi:hypothetical protein